MKIIRYTFLGISFGLAFIGEKGMNKTDKLSELTSKIYDLSNVNSSCPLSALQITNITTQAQSMITSATLQELNLTNENSLMFFFNFKLIRIILVV